MKSFDEFGVENCKMVLVEERPCQNRKQLEGEKDNILKMIRAILTRCIVGGTWMEYYDATREHHLLTVKKILK